MTGLKTIYNLSVSLKKYSNENISPLPSIILALASSQNPRQTL
jgi:hypothetical protein